MEFNSFSIFIFSSSANLLTEPDKRRLKPKIFAPQDLANIREAVAKIVVVGDRY